jgi:hypothetical protein
MYVAQSVEDCDIKKALGFGEISSYQGYITMILDEVATHHHTAMVYLWRVGMNINSKLSICDCSLLWYGANGGCSGLYRILQYCYLNPW